LAGLEQGKHVLTEARMARNTEEARQMLAASQQHPRLVCQIVPSPFGLTGHQVVRDVIDTGFLGTLREVVVLGTNGDWSDSHAPLHWRQSAELSGLNALSLGILHETLIRWVPNPVRVLAQVQFFTRERADRTSGHIHAVGTPDSVHVLTRIAGGAQGLYHLSGVIHHGPTPQIHLHGSEGTLKYLLSPEDRLFGATRGQTELREIPFPSDMIGRWRVEEEFISCIRGEGPVRFTDFATGLRYMEFTEAVALSAARGSAVDLPLR
jgi:predicted dehydrogenase